MSKMHGPGVAAVVGILERSYRAVIWAGRLHMYSYDVV